MQVAKGNDPIYKEERTLYGVEDKEEFAREAKEKGARQQEHRHKHCRVCKPGKRCKSIFGKCEVREEIRCGCCEYHRKNCVLKD